MQGSTGPAIRGIHSAVASSRQLVVLITGSVFGVLQLKTHHRSAHDQAVTGLPRQPVSTGLAIGVPMRTSRLLWIVRRHGR
jgi:hypothetical protein